MDVIEVGIADLTCAEAEYEAAAVIPGTFSSF